jgi:hypothetical protein
MIRVIKAIFVWVVEGATILFLTCAFFELYVLLGGH